MLATLYLAFGRVLSPLEALAAGLTRLERQDYSPRLEQPDTGNSRSSPGASTASPRRWRRRGRPTATSPSSSSPPRTTSAGTALDLHDEFGPCLFTLEANAASIARIAATLPEPARGRLEERTGDIAAITKRVQTLNRALLNRLRPAGLGQAPLAACLDRLVREAGRHHAGLAVSGDFAGLRGGYGDVVDLTVFRCVQEGLTNALRHARPGGSRRAPARPTGC